MFIIVPFDPKSLDMLVFKDLNVCIFDSTAPHEYFPSLESDEIVDVCKEAIKEGTDEKYKAELDAIKADYASHIAAATGHLKAPVSVTSALTENILNA